MDLELSNHRLKSHQHSRFIHVKHYTQTTIPPTHKEKPIRLYKQLSIHAAILRKPDVIALGLCLYFVILAVFYAANTPPFEAPDEASHFLYIHNLLETGQLPILEDRATMFESQSVQRHHPPLYYLIGALLISWTERDDLPMYLLTGR